MLFAADVCICGGGPAGVASAVNAARNNVEVVLIERGVALGGLGVLGCVYPFMDPHALDADTPYLAELKQRLRDKGIEPFDGVTQQTWHNPETLALIHDEMCEESGVNILYQTVVIDSITSGGKISAVIVQTIAGLAAVTAKTFIDATGDAYLARCSGVDYERGYEKTGNNQPLSFRFEMGGIDTQKLYNYVAIELQEDWCKSKLPYFEIAEAMHRKQRYKLEAFMAHGVETGELSATKPQCSVPASHGALRASTILLRTTITIRAALPTRFVALPGLVSFCRRQCEFSRRVTASARRRALRRQRDVASNERDSTAQQLNVMTAL